MLSGRRTILILQSLGLCIFVAAFYMPAVRGAETGPGTMAGWMCAAVALAATGGIFHAAAAATEGKDLPGIICLILSGWVNPLVLLYLLFSIWRKFVRIRCVLAVAILICFADTWFFFFKAPMIPLIGHFLWVAGALMILSGEAWDWFRRKKTNEL
jgi:uncharacterized membrane protein